MFFPEVLNEDMGCASYVAADGGEAAVVDPKWETEEYLEIAEDNGFKIAHILETHNHTGHLSGRGHLAGARRSTSPRTQASNTSTSRSTKLMS